MQIVDHRVDQMIEEHDLADAIELRAEAEIAQKMFELLKRYDDGSLGTLLKRYRRDLLEDEK